MNIHMTINPAVVGVCAYVLVGFIVAVIAEALRPYPDKHSYEYEFLKTERVGINMVMSIFWPCTLLVLALYGLVCMPIYFVFYKLPQLIVGKKQ